VAGEACVLCARESFLELVRAILLLPTFNFFCLVLFNVRESKSVTRAVTVVKTGYYLINIDP